jgi:TctA family transporter
MLEKSLRQSLLMSYGNPMTFFTRPISGLCLFVALILPLLAIFFKRRLNLLK